VKKLMKYAILPRALVLLLALTLAVTASVLPAAAAAEKVYTEWVYDEASKTLTATFPDGDTEVYYRVENDSRLRYDPDYRYKYYNSVSINGSSYKIYAAEEEGDTLALLGFNEDWIFFVTEEQMKEVEELYEAKSDGHATTLAYRKIGQDKYSKSSLKVKGSFCGNMASLTKDPDAETLTDTLYGLRYAPRYELWLYDWDKMVAVNYGFMFDLMGELYYLPVEGLPAAALDVRGELNPTEAVTVTLYRLPDLLTEDVTDGISGASYGYHYSVENEGGYMGGLIDPNIPDEDLPVGLVYFTIAFLGIILPIAPLVLGLCLPHSAKQGYQKRWYLLTYLSGAWMVMGVVLLVAMIVAL
jgi:hypothetical protein